MTENSDEMPITRSDEDIRMWGLNFQRECIENMSELLTPEFMAMVAYQGFDPKKTLSIIEAVNDTEKDSNIRKMIVTFLTKGNKLSSIMKKSSADDKNFLKKMINKYGLIDNTGQKGSEAVSLSRIAASYPVLTLQLINTDPHIRTSRPVKSTEMETYSKNFPPVLMTAIAASVIPQNDCLAASDREAVINAILLYCMLETRKLNRTKANDNWRQLSAHCLTYVNASHKSSLLNETQRKDFCSSETMEDVFTATPEKLTVKPAVLNASKVYENLIKSV